MTGLLTVAFTASSTGRRTVAVSVHRKCGRTFAGLSGFDHHLRWLGHHPWVECVDPAERRMTFQDGVWFKQAPSRASSGNSPD